MFQLRLLIAREKTETHTERETDSQRERERELGLSLQKLKSFSLSSSPFLQKQTALIFVRVLKNVAGGASLAGRNRRNEQVILRQKRLLFMDSVRGTIRASLLRRRIVVVGAHSDGGDERRRQVVGPELEKLPGVVGDRRRPEVEDLHSPIQQEPVQQDEIPIRPLELRAEFRRGSGAERSFG